MKNGISLYQQGKFARARLELQTAAAAEPENAEIYYRLGLVDEHQGDLAAALTDYGRAAAPAARHLKAQLKLAALLADTGRWTDALQHINITLGTMPDNAAALGMRADIEERAGLLDPARTDADAALKADPANAAAIAVLADRALKDHAPARALAILDRQVATGSHDLRLLRVRAAALAALHRWDDAIATGQRIIAAVPRDPKARLGLAEIEDLAGRAAEAEETLRDGLRAAPGDHDMAFALVDFLMKNRGRAAAEDALKSLIATAPADSAYDIALATMQDRDGDRDAAIASLVAATARLGTAPAGLKARIGLAKLRAQAGERDQAERLLNGVIAIDPNNDDALITRATLRMVAGRNEDAAGDLTAVIRRDPGNVTALEALAVAYGDRGDTTHAVEAMRRAADTRPDDLDLQLHLAVLLQHAGQVPAAQTVLDAATDRAPNSTVIWETRAQLAIARADWDSADTALARLQALAPLSAGTWRIEGGLDLARGKPEAAVSAFARLIAVPRQPDPADLAAYARASIAAGQPGAGADRLLARANSLTGGIAQACYLLVADLRIAGHQWNDADSAFVRAVAIAPKDPAPYVSYGQQMIAIHRDDRALQIAAQGLRAGAPRRQLLLLQGAAEMGANRIAAALATYHTILQTDPTSLIAANNYASLLSDFAPTDTGRLLEARRYLAPAAQSTNPALLDSLAWLDYRLGDFDVAKGLLERAHRAAPTDPAINRHYQTVLAETGRPHVDKTPTADRNIPPLAGVAITVPVAQRE